MAGLEGRIIGGCRIIRRLGGGGMGEVYLAEQISLARQVAIKLVRPEAEAPGASGGASLAERFAREARAIAAMEHPHILPVYDFGEQDDLAYLVMAYAPNGSLQEALTPGHPLFRFGLPLSLDLTGVILDQAAQALQHAHDRGVLHRDVKPANFLMGAGPPGAIHLLLADFGLAKFTAAAATSGVYSGTAAYSAPEQIQRQAIPASDQYSLAAMAYLLLTGQLPFQGGLLEIVTKQLAAPVPSMRTISLAIPAAVDQAVLRALAKRPEDRWPSVIVFAAAYREACARARSEAAAFPAAAFPAAAPAAAPPPQPLPGAPGVPPVGQPAQQPAVQRPPDPGATQVAAARPGGAAFAPPAQRTVQERWPADDSFVAAGPLPPPPIQPYGPPRRSQTGWLALAGGLSVVIVIILIVTLVNGRLGSTTANGGLPNTPGMSGTPGITVTPGPGSTVPVVPSGEHIKSVQTGHLIEGDILSCHNMQVEQPTTTFRQADEDIWLIFTAVNDGNPKATAGTALIDNQQQVVVADFPLPLSCPGTAIYPSVLSISRVPPGQYILGVFYSETNTLPRQPEVTTIITITP